MNVNDSGFAAGGPDLETTRAEVLGRVAEILPLLEREAETAERNGNLSAQSFAALVDSGALRLFAPRRAGGFEAGYRTYVETTLMLARACGSSAWFSFIINHGDW
jgi:alkylation response protein AidB-like acyl-CoA dehydrogenase